LRRAFAFNNRLSIGQEKLAEIRDSDELQCKEPN
jgi:hypothetical protein